METKSSRRQQVEYSYGIFESGSETRLVAKLEGATGVSNNGVHRLLQQVTRVYLGRDARYELYA